MRRHILSAACGIAVLIAASSGMAATVTINPPAGTVTNVREFVTGEDALAVNTGATGGTVHLNPSSSHTGGTTLGSGTLVISQPIGADVSVGELGAGPFVQQGGTLRYAGPADGVWTRAVTNTASSATGAVVWQVDNDLTMAGDLQQTAGGFVKTGSGTLTLTQPFSFGGATEVPGTTRKSGLDLSPDRAPTQGYGNFTLADGTVIIDTPVSDDSPITAPATNVLTAAGVATVGTLTTLDGTETTGILEQRGGVTRTAGILSIGFCNGSTNNSEMPLSPTVRVTGGRFLVGATGTSPVYMGVNESVSAFQGPRSAPLLDVSSANRFLCKTIHMAYTPGASSTIRVHDGGYLYALDGHVYTGNYKTYDDPEPTTNLVEVTGEGSWMSFQNFSNDPKKNGMVTTFRIADGGTVEMRNFVNSTKGKLHLVVDGGVWRHRNHNSTSAHFPSSMTSIKVGPGGFYTYFNNGSNDFPVVWEKGIEPLDNSGTDGGLHITRGSGSLPYLNINAANTYCGPTEISFTRVYLGKNGKLPSGTALSVYGNNGGLAAVRLVKHGAHDRRGLAVVAVEEVGDERLRRQVGVPHPLCEQPPLQLGEACVPSLAGALLEQHLHAVVAKELHVLMEHVHVRERMRVAAEVRHVVPHVETIRLAVPVLHVLEEAHVLRMRTRGERTREVAFDRAEAGNHVVAQLRLFRRMARVLVGERLDDLVRELLLHRLGDRVHEPHHRAGVRALLVVHGLARRALAPVAPVVLAHAVELRARILADPREHVRGHETQHVGIREAELRALLQALALHHAVVLGMRVEVLLRRQEPLERVAVAEAAAEAPRVAAVARLLSVRAAVHAVARGEVALEVVPPVDVAAEERGRLRVVEVVGHGEGVARGHDGVPRGVPAAAAVALQQLVHAVEHAAHVRAYHVQMRRPRHDPKTVVATGTTGILPVALGQRASRPLSDPPQHDRLRRQWPLIRHDRQTHAREALREVAQLLGRVLHRRRCVRSAHDRVLRRASAHREVERPSPATWHNENSRHQTDDRR